LTYEQQLPEVPASMVSGVPGAGGGDALKHILAGNADFAFTNVEPLFFALQEGAKLRAVYRAAELATKYATDGKDVERNWAIIDLHNGSIVSATTETKGLCFFDLELLKEVESTFFDLGITKQLLTSRTYSLTSLCPTCKEANTKSCTITGQLW
jgi:hypothetical protein